jgi:hypothetical protein
MASGPMISLRRLAASREPEEKCDLCSEPLMPGHRHLLDVGNQRLACCCQPCSILFSSDAAGRYRLVRHRVRFLPAFDIPEELWEGLGLPVSVAFFQHSLPSGQVVARYPSPAGATESLLTFNTWEELERLNPLLREMDPGVEALLVNRTAGAREHFLVSIDECYRLVGLIRLSWRGLSGGTEVWKEIANFFGALKHDAEIVTTDHA